jgi:hypothetical protein
MTVTDIFIGATILGLFVSGTICLVLGYADYYVIGVLQQFNEGLPPSVNPGTAITSLLSASSSFAEFFPTLALVLTVILIAETWALSAFISQHPLSAVTGIISLVAFTIVSFYVANQAIGIARLAIFATYITNADPLLYAWVYMPYILVISSLIDITIGLVAARKA